jgi:hypothetical protein
MSDITSTRVISSVFGGIAGFVLSPRAIEWEKNKVSEILKKAMDLSPKSNKIVGTACTAMLMNLSLDLVENFVLPTGESYGVYAFTVFKVSSLAFQLLLASHLGIWSQTEPNENNLHHRSAMVAAIALSSHVVKTLYSNGVTVSLATGDLTAFLTSRLLTRPLPQDA